MSELGAISKIFDFSNCSIVDEGKSYMFNWYHIKNSQGEEQFLRQYSQMDYVLQFLKEAKWYSEYIKESDDSILKFSAPLIKYGVKENTQEAEVLQKYCGIPISSIRQKGISSDYLFLQYMENILRECTLMIKNKKAVHGSICPDNILYDRNGQVLRFQGTCNFALAASIQGSTYCTCKNAYYQLANNLDAEQATKADIKAIALSVYEIGMLPDNSGEIKKLYQFQDKQMCVRFHELLEYPYHILKVHQIEERYQKLLTCIIDIITDKDCSFDCVLSRYPNKVQPVDAQGLMMTCKIDSNEVKGFDEQTMKAKRFGSFNVYLVEYQNPANGKPFVLKKGDHIKREKEILDYLDNINVKHLAKIRKDIQVDPRNQLAIEYGGYNFSVYFAHMGNSSLVLSDLVNTIYLIMNDLLTAKVFHCDIKPLNIALNNHTPKLFDYDVSIKEFSNLSGTIDEVKTFETRGASVEYASPEMLKALLQCENKISLNPWKSDLYSMGRTVIFTLAHTFELNEILNEFYGANNIMASQVPKFLEEQMTVEEIHESRSLFCILSRNLLIESAALKIMLARFLLNNNDKFVSNVKNYKGKYYKCSEAENKTLMEFLSTTVETDPNHRPSIKDLEKKAKYENSNMSTFQINTIALNTYKNTIINTQYKIVHSLHSSE